MRYLISASRRTDIPAFYSEWLINRLIEGFVYVQHPYSRKWKRVPLAANDVEGIVLWSKNFAPLLPKLEDIERITRNLFFHFTITGNKELELNVPDLSQTVKDFIYLVKRFSPAHIIWRYDPICITDRLPFRFYLENFKLCAGKLKGHAQMCYISFANPYKKVESNLKKYKKQLLIEVSEEDKKYYARRMADIAERHGIQLYACCNDFLLSDKVMKGSCVDGNYLSKIFHTPINSKKSPTRQECACTKSIDIGVYDTCLHGCLYCYANTDKREAKAAFKCHNPEWNSLCMDVSEDLIQVSEKQQTLFVSIRET